MAVPGETVQSSRCRRCGGDLLRPQQRALPFGKLWRPLRSVAKHRSHLGTRYTRTVVCCTNDGGPRKRQSDSKKDFKGPKSEERSEQIRNLLAERMKASTEKAPKRKLSLQETSVQQWKALVNLVPTAVGLPGTAAILAGYYLHLDPYGHLHWSSADALIGLAGAVPVALADACLMIPDFSANRTKKYVKLDVSSIQAEAAKVKERLAERVSQSEELQSRVDDVQQSSRQSDPASASDSRLDALHTLHKLRDQQLSSTDIIAEHQHSDDDASSSQSADAERSASGQGANHSRAEDNPFKVGITQPGKQNLVQETLDMWQRKAVLENPGLDFLLPIELMLIFFSELTREMLFRAIILKGLSGWVTDRLYEAGAEDSLSVAGDASMSVSDTGKWTALAVLLGVQFGAAAWGMLKPARVTIQGGEGLSGNGKSPADRKEQKQKIMGLLTNITQKMSRQRKAAIVVQTARDSLSLAAYGGTFLLTDNLLTPCVASVSCNMLFSLYQRAKYQKLQSRTQQHIVSMLEDFQAVKKASQQKNSVSAPGHAEQDEPDQ